MKKLLDPLEVDVVKILKQIIEEAIEKSFENNQLSSHYPIKLEHPTVKNYGDYSTNVAMILAGQLKMSPAGISGKITSVINNMIQDGQTISHKADSNGDKPVIISVKDILESVSTVSSGFINFTLQPRFLISLITDVLNSDNIVPTTLSGIQPVSSRLSGKKISVEYTDPNPFKEFHLGHMYSNFIGEAIARLFEASGATVWRGDFYGDVGMHVAKSVWGMMKKMKESNIKIQNLEKLSLTERQKFLGQGYAIGTIKYDEDPKIQQEIKDINLLIYVASQEILKQKKGWEPIVNYRQYIKGKASQLAEISEIYEAGLRWSLDYFESIYKRLGTKYDGYYPESWVGEYGMQLVDKGLKMGVLEKNEGVIVYRGEKDGYHTRVFVNKLGLPTYEAKDLGLAQAKYQDFKYDLSINVFGKEIDEYYKVVRSAMEKIDPELGNKSNYIAHGMVKLPEGKMSSRSGNVITFLGLLEEVKQEVLAIMKTLDLKDDEKQQIAEVVGVGAVRYALLKGSPGNDVVFDLKKSVSFEGDSGPYLQYTYARCKSVIRKAIEVSGISHLVSDMKKKEYDIQNTKYKIQSNEELSLIRTLYLYPEIVLSAAKTLSPNLVAGYLFELAQAFNLFYQKNSILGQNTKNEKQRTENTEQITKNKEQQKEIIEFRLWLTDTTAEILKRGLMLLGIKTVERM